MTKEEQDEILNKEIGGVKISDMSGLAFRQWALKQLDGLSAFKVGVAPLVQSLNVSIGNMPPEDKIDIIISLRKIGLDI